ncbi:hypothetical protein [Halobacteriovorax sp. JY17]|uniref:hypothetical protein n=1 Tax=Halobacteriovorax sp. JY17 TaxID=2014617 RepID=UPI000C4C3840|nr:hypothetical protein [Halobacteriovorax sp. JY17]PIK16360.1 MAG: hypothetical protein CES88_06355 [Halobacteriovorax sp. JY17]
MTKYIYIFSIALLFSCSSVLTPTSSRTPASIEDDPNCANVVRKFITNDYNESLLKEIENKDLIKRSTNTMQIKLPKKSWWNKFKDSWTHTFKNWNDNKYVSFYMYDEEETVASAAAYAKFLRKTVDQVEVNKDEESVLKTIDTWFTKYTHYEKELNDLINERVSLAYNRDILKKYNFEGNRAEVDLIFVKNGEEVHEKMIFYKDDKNLQYYIKQLDKRITELDGGMFDWWFDEGVIKQRIIQQAMLQDKLIITHRELEYYINNTEGITAGTLQTLKLKLKQFEEAIDNLNFTPSKYGINKIANRSIRKEIAALPKTVKTFKKVQDGKKVMNELLTDQDKDRLKFFTNGYARVFQGTALGAFATGSGTSIWIGLKEYFMWGENKKYACVKLPEEKEFLNCIQEYIEKRYPVLFQAAILSGDFNPFDYENIPEDQKESYMEELEHIKRLRVTFKILEARKKKTREDLSESIKTMYDSIVINEDELHSCARLTLELFPGCMIDYLMQKFPGVFSAWTTQNGDLKGGEVDIYDFKSIPDNYRELYKVEVEKISAQRATYEDFYSDFSKDAVFLLE